jgi:hypothetical protein
MAERTASPSMGLVVAGRFITVPNLNPGKLIPGPEDWRALERRASSFRV